MTGQDGSPHAHHWTLDPTVDFLNHGSFGACPRAVLQVQAELRARIEAQPVKFFVRDLPDLLDGARAELAAFVGAEVSDLVFVTNATAGVNCVLRSLCTAPALRGGASFALEPGDELLVTNHAYRACHNAIEFAARSRGARLVVAEVPFPLCEAGQVLDAVLAACTPRTKLALIDHVTSPTGVIFPIAELVRALHATGVRVLVDGAHAPGMVPIDLRALGADYYTGNCHKWLCTPKSAGFLHVAREHHAHVRPLVISHGASADTSVRSRLWHEFDWIGTTDPTPQLCVPAALAFLRGLDGDWNAHYAANRALALQGRGLLCDALGISAPCPDEMIGSLASVPLPDGSPWELHDALIDRAGIEVPLSPWPHPPRRLIRISAQRYNHLDQYSRLASALRELL